MVQCIYNLDLCWAEDKPNQTCFSDNEIICKIIIDHLKGSFVAQHSFRSLFYDEIRPTESDLFFQLSVMR